jgi:hypothetical protein
MTRENLYVALTRGRQANLAYVAVDQPDPTHDDTHPGDHHADATARSVLAGVLAHSGIELSAHETLAVEQDTWGSIAQLGAEYETLAAAAQADRWASLIRASGLTVEQSDDAITSEAFGALTSEMRRAEANHHDLDTLLPRLVRARGFEDADDVAAVLHFRVSRATQRPAGSGRTRQAPRLIVGLIPEARGSMTADMRQALTERRDLIVQRATAILDTALAEREPWTGALGPIPTDERAAGAWRHAARTVAAYRDRYHITSPQPLGPAPADEAERLDAARARAALDRAQRLANPQARQPEPARRAPARSTGRSL